MRRFKRAILRARGERLGVKESRYVREAWDRYQRIRYGAGLRAAFVHRGTKPKRRWWNG